MFGYVIEGVGVDIDEGAKKSPQLCCAEHGASFVENAVELGYTRLMQLLSAGAFGFMLLLPLELLFTLFGFPLLLLLVLLSLLFVVALACFLRF